MKLEVKVKEGSYVFLECVTFEEAEQRSIKEGCDGIEIKSISQVNYEEAFPFDECKFWFKAVLTYADLDTGKEKGHPVLVQADTVKMAEEHIAISMKDSVADWDIKSIQLTTILAVCEQ